MRLASGSANKRPKVARNECAAGKASVDASISSKNESGRCTKLVRSDFEETARVLLQREATADPMNSEEENDLEPVVVRTGVSQDEVLKFRDKCEKLPFRIRFRPIQEYGDAGQIMGKVIAKELPRPAHETTIGFVNEELADGLFTKYGVRKALRFQCAPTCVIPGHGIKEPDGTWEGKDLVIGPTVLDIGDGNPFPPCVMEVAFANESLPSLKAEVREWISPTTSVMVAIGIKIFRRHRNGLRRMLALVYRRGVANPEQAVEFGSTLPSAMGLQLRIQVADLFHGVALPPGYNAGDTVAIDLAALQAEILKKLP